MRESIVDIEKTDSGLGGLSSKICMVCGDKALGYNFNAVTCESCKAFFRRNALSNKEFTCPFTEDCKVTVVTRRFCQKCRLQKCFHVGMKKEYIMSEEDKVMKRRKIEQNRAKKRINGNINDDTVFNGDSSITPIKLKKDEKRGQKSVQHLPLLPSVYGTITSPLNQPMSPSVITSIKKEINSPSPDNMNTCQSYESTPAMSSFASSSSSCSYDAQQHFSPLTPQQKFTPPSPAPLFSDFIPRYTNASSSPCPISSTTSNSSATYDKSQFEATSESLPSEIVASMIHSKIGTKNTMDKLMKTPKDAVYVMSKIISSPKDAMELIGHLIQSPGDALHIISKIMNSPLDALTVFTQFMSSPTDSFQIIGKIMSSPADVLQFMQQLMNCPEDALQIMNKFMNAPVEALKIINKMINQQQADSTTLSNENSRINGINFDTQNVVIRSVLESVDSRHPNQFLHTKPDGDTSSASVNPNSSSSCENISNSPNEQLQKTEDIIQEVLEDIRTPPLTPNASDFEAAAQSPTTKKTKSSWFDSILSEAIRQEYESYNIIEQSSCSGKDLNSIEEEKLKELIYANEALYDPVDEEYDLENTWQETSNQENTELLRVINLTAVAIRRFIKMAKKINAFKNMCQEDQLALLKGSCIEMMILRSLMQYDENENIWKIPHRNMKDTLVNIRADVLKLAKYNIYEKHQTFIGDFDKKWKSDSNIIPIMCAITLFTPDRSRTVHSDVIKLEQTSYYCLLRRYLESIYPGCEAKATFLKLIKKIKELKKLNDEFIHVYLNVNPTQIEPLLLEIFDLKCKANVS